MNKKMLRILRAKARQEEFAKLSPLQKLHRVAQNMGQYEAAKKGVYSVPGAFKWSQ